VTKMQRWHELHKEQAAAAIQTARAFVAQMRAATVCSRCGLQPIEWHSDRHLEHPTFRISTMAGKGYSPAKIAAEMARCEALCRKCHVTADGRLAFLRLGPTHPTCRANLWPERV
jgi:hypothetical protein